MAYVTAEARQQLLDDVAAATDTIGIALACLGEAYEQLDEHSADRLEEELFRPVQLAYGRARRTHAEFAKRYRMPGRAFAPGATRGASGGVPGLLDAAVAAVGEADAPPARLDEPRKPDPGGDAP